ncbi:hypothetical protein P4S95_12290, partial [Aneurinibacillus aneurinilyticus]|uniref:hypothetical protein n=1 Tax=Aneurinibacillus aneurinilyticus TaxID=1391 RepID=UPI002E1D6C6A|nr:hypothetical protein [Aneurinibacillus aneurinilyticus]
RIQSTNTICLDGDVVLSKKFKLTHNLLGECIQLLIQLKRGASMSSVIGAINIGAMDNGPTIIAKSTAFISPKAMNKGIHPTPVHTQPHSMKCK